ALKLRHAHQLRERAAAADPPRQKKLKALDKELDKRRTRHNEARVRALRARADYVLSLEAANATLQRYYLDDIADIILCMEVGFEAVVGRAVRTAGAADEARAAATAGAAGAWRGAAAALDALAGRQRLLDAHAPAFALPRPLPYQGAAPDAQDQEMLALLGEAAPDAAAPDVAAELAQRLAMLDAGARQLRAECRENAKTLDAAEAELIKQMEGSDSQWDVSGLFGAAGGGASALPAAAPPLPEDQEDYYLAVKIPFIRVVCGAAGAAGEQGGGGARAAAGRGRGAGAGGGARSPPTPPRRAAARLRRGQFAAPLDLRLPVVLTSCVRVIATYGLRHQGIFRVSGSQVEMQALRAAFERGEDPLAGVRDASDINSVCGLLKLYLREVRPPLLPPQLQERLLRVAALADDAAFVRGMRDTLAALPAPAVLVLRYLFAFLAHLTEHSDHNMMDAWNLAICLGPTLLAAWGEGGAQVAAQNLVNELVKRIILHHAAVFPQDIAPYALYTRHSEEEGGADDEADEPDAAPGERDSRDARDRYDARDADDAPDSHDQQQSHDAHDPTDDLSLCDVDDEDTDDISDEDCESGDWGERDSGEYRRCRRASRRPPPPRPAGWPTRPTWCWTCRRAPRPTPPTRSRTTATRCASGACRPRPPVPARNTARVAAKFAELTLTGGSLKPALAAKPALLRRPTPHPAPHAPHAP
ncbi:SLIT-ROBO Rho GTPase-activating protein 2-like, partial [Trichoplusia ni]|uniref:SLIT-ROBO Rho GTPase-activating protein 2-like n=1 Tax=Trichoplusia ni TaxID=7111 RepID=A0A7E5X0B1_TRINI